LVSLSSSHVLEGLLRQNHKSLRYSRLSSQYPEIPDYLLPSLFSLYLTNDIDLTLFWSTRPSDSTSNMTMSNVGHHYLLGVHLGLHESPLDSHVAKKFSSLHAASTSALLNPGSYGRSLFAAAEKEKIAIVNSLSKAHSTQQKPESPLKHVLVAPDTVKFNFASKRNCELEIKILVHNCSVNKQVDFSVEFLSQDGGQQAGASTLAIGSSSSSSLPPSAPASSLASNSTSNPTYASTPSLAIPPHLTLQSSQSSLHNPSSPMVSTPPNAAQQSVIQQQPLPIQSQPQQAILQHQSSTSSLLSPPSTTASSVPSSSTTQTQAIQQTASSTVISGTASLHQNHPQQAHNNPAQPTFVNSPKCFAFSWIGATKQFAHISPGKSTEITIYASFPSPGIYDLSKIRLKIIHPTELTHLSPNIQHLITILHDQNA